MKRPSATHQAPSKKQKKAPLESETEITPQKEQNDNSVDVQWEKVEKRKAKKARKIDAKLDVCVLSFTFCRPVTLTSPRQTPHDSYTLTLRSPDAETLLA
jgi:hypothetical protein